MISKPTRTRISFSSPLDPFEPLDDYKKFSQAGHFKELQIGAGDSTFKASGGYVWGGAGSYSNGSFKLNLSTGALELTGAITATSGSITGDLTVTGSLAIGDNTGSALALSGTTGNVDLKFNGTTVGTLSGLSTAVGSETEYVKLSNTSGRYLSFRASEIACDGNFNPTEDEGSSLGSSSKSWNDIYAKSLIANGSGAKFSINGNDGENANETGVTNFDITIIGGIITSFTKN